MRRAALALALAFVVPGCAFPWQKEREDPAAQGPPEPVDLRWEHDYLGNARSLAFRLNTSTGTVTVGLDIVQNEGVPACRPDRTPARIVLMKPDEVKVLELTAGNAEGSPRATTDGAGECGATLRQEVPRTRGVWRIEFLGSGNFTALATVKGEGAPAMPTA